MWDSLYTYVPWTIRITLIALVFVWLKRMLAGAGPTRSPEPHRRNKDILMALMLCGGGTFFILMCDPRNSLSSSMEAWELWEANHPGVRAPEDWLDVCRDNYHKGLLLGFLGLEALVLPAYLALRRKAEMSNRGAGPTPTGDLPGDAR